jgi:hypothetical protein
LGARRHGDAKARYKPTRENQKSGQNGCGNKKKEAFLREGKLIIHQGTMVVVSPGTTIWITPPQVQFSFEVLSRTGILASITVAEPGAHGAGVTGTQGMGVSTPRAAAVAAATVGFDGELHIPNVATLTIGFPSMMLAAGTPVVTMFTGNTTSDAGAAPKLH